MAVAEWLGGAAVRCWRGGGGRDCGGCGIGRREGGGWGSSSGRVIGGHGGGGRGIGGRGTVEQPQCGSSSVVAAAVWQRQQRGVGSPVASAWQYQHDGVIAVAGQQIKCGIVSVQAAEAGPCGESGVAVAVWQQRQMAAAGRSRPGVINQGIARAFARVRRPGVLTFAAVSEVGVNGRRVDGGHL